ncbi:hypothetical protein N7539_007131 [Penicillium diatomitis]|uniref:Uncharacterized protein n=1 Tax=Penicillium diatomitis TaxID=2819901 RepID=A0A9W9WUZ7_9EURO|nr:uncharacterized protein N7539_007131 [Penicillium diatomitis]KAJ5476987.1 hypothetical protein N7539_007131 [Penicillium diatomitis]
MTDEVQFLLFVFIALQVQIVRHGPLPLYSLAYALGILEDPKWLVECGRRYGYGYGYEGEDRSESESEDVEVELTMEYAGTETGGDPRKLGEGDWDRTMSLHVRREDMERGGSTLESTCGEDWGGGCVDDERRSREYVLIEEGEGEVQSERGSERIADSVVVGDDVDAICETVSRAGDKMSQTQTRDEYVARQTDPTDRPIDLQVDEQQVGLDAELDPKPKYEAALQHLKSMSSWFTFRSNNHNISMSPKRIATQHRQHTDNPPFLNAYTYRPQQDQPTLPSDSHHPDSHSHKEQQSRTDHQHQHQQHTNPSTFQFTPKYQRPPPACPSSPIPDPDEALPFANYFFGRKGLQYYLDLDRDSDEDAYSPLNWVIPEYARGRSTRRSLEDIEPILDRKAKLPLGRRDAPVLTTGTRLVGLEGASE